jgi:hypothetical protein
VKGTGFFFYYKAAAIFAAVSFALGAIGRRVYLLDLFLFSIAFKGAWDSARAVSMMGLFLSPGTAIHLTGFLEKAGEWFSKKVPRGSAEPDKAAGRKKRRKKEAGKGTKVPQPIPAPRTSWGRLSVTAVTVIALLVFGGANLAFSFSQLQFGVGITEHKFSFAAAEFLRKNPIRGNMFNFFDIGGFLDWQLYPRALTFIDGRTYNQQVFLEHQTVTGALPGWQEILRRYGVTYAVLKTMDSSGMILPIIQTLTNDTEWRLVFADGLFVIFVRNIPENREYIRKHEIPKTMLPRQIIWEAYHYMYLGVSPLVAYQTMSNMYQLMGNTPAAIQALKKALEEKNDPYLRSQLIRLERMSAPR